MHIYFEAVEVVRVLKMCVVHFYLCLIPFRYTLYFISFHLKMTEIAFCTVYMHSTLFVHLRKMSIGKRIKIRYMILGFDMEWNANEITSTKSTIVVVWLSRSLFICSVNVVVVVGSSSSFFFVVLRINLTSWQIESVWGKCTLDREKW